MKKLYSYLLVSLLSGNALAQQTLVTDTVPAKLIFSVQNNEVKFDAELRALRAIAGAPAPFYSYFWEFGDGHFSFKQYPVHHYADSGTYHPRLYATNNYDDGKVPPTRPGKINIKTKPTTRSLMVSADVFKDSENIVLKTNRMPRPQEEMVLILGYRNQQTAGILSKSGTVALFYNDVEFEKDNFKITDIRMHHQEKKSDINQLLQLSALERINFQYYASSGPNVPIMTFSTLNKNTTQIIQEKKALFRNVEAWKYEGLNVSEERFMFLSLETTPEMIKDTNAVVNLSALFIPDDPMADIGVYNLELQIVASHDPNKMILRNQSINYRFLGKNKTLDYKVKFQNTGKGPAKLVNVGVEIPEVLDKVSIKIIDTSPKVIMCDSAYTGQSCLDTVIKKDSVHFIFRNIYLPGVQQEGVNDADSTKGFVAYEIKFMEKPKKLPFASSAAIIFDKNEPIYTNKVRGKFKPGLSPGIIVGYGFSNDAVKGFGDKNYSLGFSISPYSPYRKYLQAELYLNSYNHSEDLMNKIDVTRDTTYNNSGATDRATYRVNGREIYQETQRVNIDIVPVHLRYNLNKFIGVGIGAFTSVTISEKTKILQRTAIEEYVIENNQPPKLPTNIYYDNLYLDKHKKTFSLLNASVFADVQIGLVRKGPAIGIRYFQGVTHKDNRIFTYFSFKL